MNSWGKFHSSLLLAITALTALPARAGSLPTQALLPIPCITLLRPTAVDASAILSAEEQKRFIQDVRKLRKYADLVLQTPASRAAYAHGMAWMENFLRGSQARIFESSHQPDLLQLAKWIEDLLENPPVTPRSQNLAYARKVLSRIRMHLAAPQHGLLTPDAWTYLAMDAARAMSGLLRNQSELAVPTELTEFFGRTPENILAPAWITTHPLSVQDFNELAVSDVVLAGLLPRVVYADGMDAGETPAEFLLNHDLQFHGRALRQNNHLEMRPLLQAMRSGKNLAQELHHWIQLRFEKLRSLRRFHEFAAYQSKTVREAADLIRFLAEREYGDRTFGSHSKNPKFYIQYLDTTPEAHPVIGSVSRISPRLEIFESIKDPHDLGLDFPLLAAMPTAQLSRTLDVAAVFLDFALSQD